MRFPILFNLMGKGAEMGVIDNRVEERFFFEIEDVLQSRVGHEDLVFRRAIGIPDQLQS